MLDPKEGDRVVIRDGSEANGDAGSVWFVQANGILLIELDDGGIWPVTANEIEAA